MYEHTICTLSRYERSTARHLLAAGPEPIVVEPRTRSLHVFRVSKSIPGIRAMRFTLDLLNKMWAGLHRTEGASRHGSVLTVLSASNAHIGPCDVTCGRAILAGATVPQARNV